MCDSRFLLWVDAVGGFLVCLDERVVLGQPARSERTDVPILADISRRHAVLRRDEGGHVIDPIQSVHVNGRRARGPTAVRDGDLIDLGSSVQLRFRRPHPLSATARLEITSRHKTQPSTNGVLLMAESCVLGPGSTNHVVCPDWQRDVILYRRASSLGCRTDGRFQIDGREVESTGPVAWDSRLEGDDFSLGLEPMCGQIARREDLT